MTKMSGWMPSSTHLRKFSRHILHFEWIKDIVQQQLQNTLQQVLKKCNIIEWRILGYSVNIYLSIYPSIHLSILSYPIYVSMYLCIYVSMYVCIYLSIYLTIYLSIHIMYTIFVPTLYLDSHVLPRWPRFSRWSFLAFCAVLLHQEAAAFRDSSLLRFLGVGENA